MMVGSKARIAPNSTYHVDQITTPGLRNKTSRSKMNSAMPRRSLNTSFTAANTVGGLRNDKNTTNNYGDNDILDLRNQSPLSHSYITQ